MARQGYPGLVLIPPSDRQIAKRRLTRWVLLTVGFVGGISALNMWLPAPHEYTDCSQNLDLHLTTDSLSPCQPEDQSSPQLRESSAAPTTVASLTSPPDFEQGSAGLPHQKGSAELAMVNRALTQQKAEQVSDRTFASSSRSKAAEDGRLPRPPLATSTSKPAVHVASRQGVPPNTPSSPPLHASAPPQIVARQIVQQEHPFASSTATMTSAPFPSKTMLPTRDHELAERGDAFAQYRLGRFYAQRDGHLAPESISWYSKASAGLRRLAEAGNGEAMYVLGVMYAFGRGVKRDTEEARRWLIQAIDHHITAARPVLASVEKHRLANLPRPDHGS